MSLSLNVCVCVCRRTARRQSVLNLSQRWSWLNRSLCWITSSSGASLMSQSSHETQSVLSYVICIRSKRHKSPLWALGMLLEGHKWKLMVFYFNFRTPNIREYICTCLPSDFRGIRKWNLYSAILECVWSHLGISLSSLSKRVPGPGMDEGR